MAIGAGKYDAMCTFVRKDTEAEGAIVVVIGGSLGSGFSVQCPPHILEKLPDILENMAAKIRTETPPKKYDLANAVCLNKEPY